MSTPNPVDFYSRYMVEMFDQRDVQATPRAFQSFFGNPAGGGITHFSIDEMTVDIDILKANGERLAAMVHRGQSSSPIDTENVIDYEWSNINRKWPLIEISGNINSTQLLKRQPGDNPYQRRTQLDRNRQLARDIHNDHIRKSVRTNEYLARESIITGKQPAIIDSTNAAWIYDFYRLASHTIGVPVPWDNGSQDILADIDNALDIGRQNAYRHLDFLAIGGDAMRAFIKDTTVKTLADNRRFELIQVSLNFPVPPRFARYIQAGWTAYGRLRTPKGREVWIFVNDDIYTDSAGDPQNYMPLDKAFLLSSQARFDRYFGPRDRMPVTPSESMWYQEMFGFSMMAPPMPANVTTEGGIIVPEAFYFDAYMPDGKKTVVMRTQSAPIFATTETDAIVVLEDLITPP